MFRWWGGGGFKHSYKVAVGTGNAVFHNRVRMLTALRLWSCTLTAALDKPKSHRLSPLAVETERKSGPDCSSKLRHESLNIVDENRRTPLFE